MAAPVDKRADIWAFGCVLYEMLTGARASAGSDVSEVLASVLAREPDWARLPADLSAVLGTYLRRCLYKDPKQRIGDIQDVRLALEGAFDTPTGASVVPPVAQPPAGWRRTAGLLLGGLALAAMGVFIAGTLSRPASRGAIRFPIPLATGQSVTGVLGSRVART